MVILRDPVWQFIGVIITAIGVIIAFIGLSGTQKHSTSVSGEVTIDPSEDSVSFAGFILLIFLLIISSYTSYILLIRLFLSDGNLPQSGFFIFNLVMIAFIVISVTFAGYGKPALLLVFHFLFASAITFSLMLFLEIGTFVYKDFSFLNNTSFVKENLSFLSGIISNLTYVPVDIKVFNPAEGRTVFLTSYIASFMFIFSVFMLRRRRKRLLYRQSIFQREQSRPNQTAESKNNSQQISVDQPQVTIKPQIHIQPQVISPAVTNQTAKIDLDKRQIRLLELEIREKELNIRIKMQESAEKQLEMEKKRLEYALALSRDTVDTFHPDTGLEDRTKLIKSLLPSLLELDKSNGSEAILRHIGISQSEKVTDPGIKI